MDETVIEWTITWVWRKFAGLIRKIKR